MTLLTIIQGAAVKVGVPKPATVIGNTNNSVQQLLEIANEDCIQLARMRPWQALAQLKTWTTVNAELQGSIATVIGADFDRFVPGTEWDRSLIRPLNGPRSPQGWAQDHALVAAGPYYSFRIFDGNFYLFPVQASGKTLSFEYVSKNWCQSSLGVGQNQWLADTDTCLLDETLVKLSIIVTYKMAKGLPCQKDLSDYQDVLADRIGVDGGNPQTLNMNAMGNRYPWPVIPYGNWPLSSVLWWSLVGLGNLMSSPELMSGSIVT